MKRYITVARMTFGVIFLLGGVVHLVLGRLAPQGYEAFGRTAVLDDLSHLWVVFVMPNIGWLTVACAVFECGVGAALLRGGDTARAAAFGALGFFAFLLILGYGFPVESVAEDLLKNRAGTPVMAGLLAPVAFCDSSRR
ncbi:hypothetical protein [Austwickia chelonae]|uniref:hypothetical protein n=1 Tax=Austwickia chelonae TaxID=100225 RepID=UPI000E24102B|nr:hypothetical protein [Austwickia chelonae]